MRYIREGQAIASAIAGIICSVMTLPALVNANDTPDWYARAALTTAAVVLAISAVVHFYAAALTQVKD